MPASRSNLIDSEPCGIVARQKARNIEVLQWAAWTLICFNIGAFFGMYAFARVTQSIGRRPTFAIFFTIAMVTTALAFGCMEKMPRDLWMVALMGGVQLSVFGGYAIYFPELFPTRLRSTGSSFCYNVGRYVAAIGPLSLAVLKPTLVKHFGDPVIGVPLCRRDDVLVLSGGARGAAVRAGDEGAAAAGVSPLDIVYNLDMSDARQIEIGRYIRLGRRVAGVVSPHSAGALAGKREALEFFLANGRRD